MFSSVAEKSYRLFLIISAMLSAAIVVFVGMFVLAEARPALAEIGLTRWLTDSRWSPTGGFFLLTPMIVATLLSSVLAVSWAAFLALVTAAFMNFSISSGWARPIRTIVELLAGVPSVVYGFWGLVTLVPLINEWHAPGASLLAAVIILGFMVLPTMLLAADVAFKAVPVDLLKAAEATGLTFNGIMRLVILPTAKNSLWSGLVLAVGRAAGETMAVLMVCGNVVQVPSSIFEPVRTLTANIALEMAYAMSVHRSALFVSGLLLFGLIVATILIADIIHQRDRYANPSA